MEMERHKLLKTVSKLMEFLLVVNISENFISGKLIELEGLCEDIALGMYGTLPKVTGCLVG